MLIHPSSTLEAHPLANLFPMCQPDTLRLMAEGMRQHGFDAGQPIVMLDGLVLDGRNRLYAAMQAGVEPVMREFCESLDGNPRLFVFRRNLPRRDLTPSQRAVLALEFQDMLGAEIPKEPGQRTRDALAEVTGASGRLIQDGRTVKEKAPDLWEKVQDGDMAITEAVKEVKKRAKDAEKVQEWEQSAPVREEQAAIIADHAPKLAAAILKGECLRDTSEVAYLAMLPPPVMKQLEPIILGGMSLQAAQKLLDNPLETSQPISALLAKAFALADTRYDGKILAMGDKHLIYRDEFKGVEVYCVMKKPKQ
jgi:hypothetical protein